MKNTLLFFALLLCVTSFSQKKEINHEAYNLWKSIPQSVLSNYGNYGAYIVKPHLGDGFGVYYSTTKLSTDTISRVKSFQFGANDNFLVAKITPGYDTLRTLELEKKPKKNWVKDSLYVINLENDSIQKFEKIKRFEVNKTSDWLALLSYENPKQKSEKKKCLFKKKKNEPKRYSSEGNQLLVINPISNESQTFSDVIDFEFGRNGIFLFYAQQKKYDADTIYLLAYNLHTGEKHEVNERFTQLGKYNFDYDGNKLALLASKDTVENNKVFDLYQWDLVSKSVTKLVDTNKVIQENKTVSNFSSPYYSRNGKRLFFGIADTPKQEPEDTLLASEKATLDLWHYQDKRLQPQQLLEKSRDEKSTLLSCLALENPDKITVLENDTLDVYTLDHSNSPVAIGISENAYQGTYNWSFPWPVDYYKVEIETGKTALIGKKIGHRATLSPSGKYFVYFDEEKTEILVKNTVTNATNCISCKQDVEWLNDINGMPHNAGPIGYVGFTKEEKSFILHSEFDVWEYNLERNTLSSLTNEEGKVNNIEYRLRVWERDSTFITMDNAYIKGFDKTTKEESVHHMHNHVNHFDLTDVYKTNHQIYSIKKAKKADAVIFKQANVKDYPNVHVTTTDFIDPTQISNANPQQEEYNWATVEQVSWVSYAGDSLNGLVYKPENYDPKKKYPLLIYYYELYSDELHNHYVPKPTASIIYGTEYASGGYLVFYPDVRYKEGYPAQSAYDCIMSGTDKMLELYPNIDSTKMGLQGQSWGGYQTAQLVTMTNRYAAGMAGAPVSNMFSAYGGIRWGSGLNRQFQYEKTQSRIGKTIWEAPELYVENSPIFGIPNIETPLLIMHNDGDGAVPWYQGIEMFVGMKRLGKPVWMLNYNGDKHNLYDNANRIDLSIRMRQFFDHYLLDKPAPKWLLEGIPATVKGKEYRLEVE